MGVRRFVLVSILFHLLLLFAFSFTVTPPLDDKTDVAVEIIEAPPAKTRGTGGAKGAGSRRLKMRDLLPALNAGLGNGKGTFGAEGDGDDPFAGWGEGGGEFERIKDYSFMRRLQSETEGLLFYPQILARHGISGTVNTRLHLRPSNGCDWHKTRVNGGHPYLKVYVTSLLKKLCGFDVAKATPEPLNVDMSFNFEITERMEDQAPENREIVGNVLVFNRNHGESVTEWKLGPIRGSWLIPVISVDFPWIFENWEKYFNGRDPFDEFKRSG
jgi:hypothetical protein